MTLRHNLDEFRREAQAIADAMPEDWKDRATRLATAVYSELTLNTEDALDTGAYRAEHVIEQNGTPLYEHPERVGPDQPLPSQKALGLGPLISAATPSEVEAEVSQRMEADGFAFVNRRHYAEHLEYGTSQMEPRQIYARAQDVAERIAETIAAEPSRNPVLRRG